MGFNILDLFLPRETKFYTYFDRQVDYLVQGCAVFKDLVVSIGKLSEEQIKGKLTEIKDCETGGDTVQVTIMDALGNTFITPIDREDIHTLAINIDRSIDILNSISRKFEIYNIRKVPANVCGFADVIVRIARELKDLMGALQARKGVDVITDRMHGLENEADELFHASMADLFNPDNSPVHIIKFKEVYEHLESVVDSIDYVGKVVRGIMVKQG